MQSELITRAQLEYEEVEVYELAAAVDTSFHDIEMITGFQIFPGGMRVSVKWCHDPVVKWVQFENLNASLQQCALNMANRAFAPIAPAAHAQNVAPEVIDLTDE